MNLATLSKHPHVNSNQLMVTIYKIQSRSMICANLSGLTISSLVNPMTRDNLDTNIITHDRNLIIMISSQFSSCYVMYHGLHLFDSKSISIQRMNIKLMKNPFILNNM